MNIFGHASRLSIIGFAVICLSSVFQLIGLITPFWIYTSALPVRLYSGLWYRCVSIGNTTTCINFHCDRLKDGTNVHVFGCSFTLIVVQALEILGLLTLVFSAIFQIVILKCHPILKMAGIGCCFLAGTFVLIGLIVYATQECIMYISLYFSFAMCSIAAFGSVVAGSMLLIG